MKTHPFLSILFFFLSFNTFSQETSLSVLTIPSELTKNANAVVRNYTVEVIIEAVDKMMVREKRTVTVLNKLGNNTIDTYTHYNKDTRITKISAVIYNSAGKKIKKYTKSKFTDVSAVSGGTLYSDARVKYLDYTPTEYPYTVVFETEYKNSSTGFVPTWFPISDYNVSVEKSNYHFVNKAKIPFRKKEKNFADYQIENTSSEYELMYVLTNQPVIKHERSTVSSLEFLPTLKIALNDFTLKGVRGHATNWKEFGKWRYDFLKNGNDNLSPTIKNKIRNLVKEVKTDIEKAKIVYNFMQNKTRYISVQEGIGGWKPIPANEVDKMGYGDCKGLTNYTKALLDAVDVKSYYSVIWAGNEQKNIDKNFSSMQGNHIILNIPNNGNDIWLECTSQTMPFGFLGSFTDDRNTLVITPEGGVIKRTPKYANEVNHQKITGNIQLDEVGNVKATIKRVSKGIQYDDKFGIEDLTKENQRKYYINNDWDYINNFEIVKITLSNNKESIVFTEELNIAIENYADITQGAYLFKVNVFNRVNHIPKRYRKRTKPLRILRGFTDEDEVEIMLPKGYKVEDLPQEKKIENKFGSYLVTVEQVNKETLKYIRKINIKEGVYPKEDYKAYRKFRKSVAKYDNLRIALIKK